MPSQFCFSISKIVLLKLFPFCLIHQFHCVLEPCNFIAEQNMLFDKVQKAG